MLRKSSKQPEWVKALMNEMLKPPEFLQGIMKDQAEQQAHTNNTTNSNEKSGTAESSANDEGTGPQRPATGRASRTQQSREFSRRQSTSKPTSLSTNQQPTIRRNSRPIVQPSSAPAQTEPEIEDAEDWVPTGMPQTESKASAGDWRTTLRQLAIPPAVVKQYGWKVTQVLPHQNIAQIKTAKATYALKSADIEPQRIVFLNDAQKYIREHGFTQLARFALTKQKRPYSRVDNQVLYATRWINGRPVRFGNQTDVGKVALALADFHEASRGFESLKYNPPMEFDLKHMFQRRYEDLKILLAQAEARSNKGTFDKLLLAMENQLRKDADRSLSLFDDADCNDFLLHEEFNPGLCHLDVIPSNFICDSTESVHLIDLDLTTYGPRVLDLGHLLRRALQVQNWNSEVAYVCFLNFDKVKRISREEYVLVQALLTFPYRAWRLANTRYRVYADASQVSALKRYRNQEENRQQFLRDLEQQIK